MSFPGEGQNSWLRQLVIPEIDRRAEKLATLRQEQLTKPSGSLGRLEQIAIQMAAWQGSEPPSARPAVAVVFAADHPVTRHGVSAYPAAVTSSMLRNFVSGGACASVMAKKLGVPLTVVDVGVTRVTDEPTSVPIPSVTLFRDPVAERFVDDIRVADAMDSDTFCAALGAGRRTIENLDPRTKVVLFGEMGIGNTTVASAVCAALIKGDARSFVGRGTGVSDEALQRKQVVVDDALRRLAGETDPLEIVRRTGGRDIAALLGAMGHALTRRITILVDGFVVSAAALALVRVAPRARRAMLFAHCSAERAHKRVLAALDARPLLDLSMRLGEASGALTAFPIVELACAVHAEMATFQAAGVPNRDCGG